MTPMPDIPVPTIVGTIIDCEVEGMEPTEMDRELNAAYYSDEDPDGLTLMLSGTAMTERGPIHFHLKYHPEGSLHLYEAAVFMESHRG